MPHALLLSPDDQAVNAITGVLEELAVTCERPLDGLSAAHQLNSRSFDLVLVDCENLPAAKLIFDVCRRATSGHNAVPIAIVDGRAGLPTAFRLGAELILTKPVAKDQARNTIRAAVTRVRKDVPASENVSAQLASEAAALNTTEPATESRAQAAAASASSQPASFAKPATSVVSNSVPNSVASSLPGNAAAAPLNATLSAAGATPKMNSAIEDIEGSPASPKLNPRTGSSPASDASEWARAASINWKPTRPVRSPDEALLPKTEKLEPSESQPAEVENSNSAPDEAVPAEPATQSADPVFSSYREGSRQKTRGSFIALLVLVLAGGGFYAAWTYQPEFRAIVQPQIDRVLVLAGSTMARLSASASPAKPPAQTAPPTTPAPAAATSSDPAKPQSATPDSVTGSAAASATGPTVTGLTANTSSTTVPTAASATATASVPMSTTPASVTPIAAVAKPTAATTTPTAPAVLKPIDTKPNSNGDAPAAIPLSAPLPGEDSAIILSSKGAERRLISSVPPSYPAKARLQGADGTVVLKALVNESGKIRGLRLVEGNATLAAAAIESVKQWRYRPYVRDGKAQPFQTIVIVDFQRP